jgi:hypothetical protein
VAHQVKNPFGKVYQHDKRAAVIKEREALGQCWSRAWHEYRPESQAKLVDYLTLAQLGQAGSEYISRRQ